MQDSRWIERTAAEWLARRDGAEWSAQQQVALDEWLAVSTRHRVAFLRLEAAWNEAGRLQALGAGLPAGSVPVRPAWSPGSALFERVAPPATASEAPHARPARRRLMQGFAATAAVLLLIAVASFGWHRAGGHEAAYASAVGQLETVSLIDGSLAVLSSDSRLQLRFTRNQRHIELQQGEAYFEVAHDPERPFVVSVDERRVVAVGTRFAVRDDTQALRVLVTEGKVRLEGGTAAAGRLPPASLLVAGSVATAGRNGVLVRTFPVAEVERLLEWRSGFLAFDDVTLAAAAAEFNRFNTRRLELADAAVGELRVGGNFRWNNVDSFANLLELGFPVRAERLPDRIVLHSR